MIEHFIFHLKKWPGSFKDITKNAFSIKSLHLPSKPDKDFCAPNIDIGHVPMTITSTFANVPPYNKTTVRARAFLSDCLRNQFMAPWFKHFLG